MPVIKTHGEDVFQTMLRRRRNTQHGEVADESRRDVVSASAGRCTGGADRNVLKQSFGSSIVFSSTTTHKRSVQRTATCNFQ